MNPMKKHLLVAIAALLSVFAAVSASQAQSALFIYNDGSGTPNAGTYTPGSTFTFSINLGFVAGGVIINLVGISYWMTQQRPCFPTPFELSFHDVIGSIVID